MSSAQTDIIVLGATGFTGRLITRYLAAHPQFTQGLFSFSIAARSQSKLHTLVQELSLPPTVNTVQFDVTDENSVEAAVRSARVVINTVGPYWTWGTPVVKACAKYGVHYVDLTGEGVWVRQIIYRYDYLATKTGAIIVPSCGYDSIPSDASAYLSNKTLKAHGDYDVATSITAHKVRGGVSGGTLSTMMTIMGEVPRDKLRESGADYSLSPVEGRPMPKFKLLYNQSIPGETSVAGAFFFMQPTNRKLVQRTFGLLEMQARIDAAGSVENLKAARRERYGPEFGYDEFLVTPSRLSAVIVSSVVAFGFGMLAMVTPFRWLVQKLMPPPGSGPSEEAMQKGFFKATNHTTSTSSPPVHVKTVFKGDRDPGYALTSIMISESALSLLLPPVSATSSSQPSASSSKSSSLPDGLPALARKGGILTPMTAFGDVLLTRLVDTGRFTIESYVVGQNAGSAQERRNDV
ncbi:Saccharopine dehydrogenase-domain-containing protein [Lyophyllum atratum]|nr:Saccharopine dehydrogenase-domain-containing protein [Lyophyllum atratum]